MSLEDAIFRNCDHFVPANLKNHLPFWEHEILKDHPHKQGILKWLQGVRKEEFLNSFTSASFQGVELNSYYPEPRHFEIRSSSDPEVPLVVCPLGVEPKKATWSMGWQICE